jgi:5-methylthioadenosine/S-adenosylhomocysteine deaminase
MSMHRTRPAVLLAFLALNLSAVSPAPARPRERVDLVVRGATVVTMDGQDRVIPNGAVAIHGERIVAVDTTDSIASRYDAARVVDAAGKVVMPGLVNTHTHVPMALFRGIADDMVLMDWLQKFIFPAEAKNVDEEFVRWGTRLGCLEMLRGGTTTFVDMYYYEDVIAEETARAGMRAVLGETVLDFPAPDNKTWDAALAYTERFLRKWTGHPLVVPAIAPHAPYTVSPEHLKAAHELATRLDAPIVIHVAEDPAEVKTIQERYRATSVGHLEALGFLEDRVIAAHMVWPTEQDIATLARRRVGVAHCPQSNMKLAAGVSPVPDLMRAGVAVGLGTDGAASNNDLSLWEEIDTAAKLHKLIRRDPTVLSAREALRLATIEGARAIDLDREIGSLEPNKRADLIVVDLGSLHQTPIYDVFSHLVYATKATDVETVLVNGRMVVENRRVLTIDEDAVRRKAVEYRDRIRKSVQGS